MNKKCFQHSAILALFASLAITSTQAADRYWSTTSCGSGSWDTNCWNGTSAATPPDGSGPPVGGDDVYLYNDTTTDYTVTYTGAIPPSPTLGSLRVDGISELLIIGGGFISSYKGNIAVHRSSANSAVTVDGSGSRWLNYTDLSVGSSGKGYLNITNGGSVSDRIATMGGGPHGHGIATIDGMGSRWTHSGTLTLGIIGAGAMNISNGGSVSNTQGTLGFTADSFGTANIDGIGSTWTNSSGLSVGYLGTGSINISNGGTLSNVMGAVGDLFGSQGIVSVDGAGSTWSNEWYMHIGPQGNGVLRITNGGTVSSSDEISLGWDRDGIGTITIAGSGSSLDGNNNMYVGEYGTGTIAITNGSAASDTNGHLGRYSGGTGTATVHGTDSTWSNSGNLYVGDAGTGTMNITNGGAVSNFHGYLGFASSGDGTVLVDGAGSNWDNSASLYVGYDGTGNMTIQNGGEVTDHNGHLGFAAGSTGTVNVDGAGSTWTNSADLYVGYDGTGTMNITNGGSVTNINGIVNSASTVTVDGPGSSWENSGTLTSDDNITITNGGSVTPIPISYPISGHASSSSSSGAIVSSTDAYIGYSSGSNSTVTVDGEGAEFTSKGTLIVGRGGNGKLNIKNGGKVTSKDGYLGYGGNSDGRATIDGLGSRWINSGNLYVGNNNLSDLGASGKGALTIKNGGLVTVANELKLYSNSAVNISGGVLNAKSIDASDNNTQFALNSGILAVETFKGNLVNMGGTLAPGHSPGITTINGDYTQSGQATLAIEIGGLIAGIEYDVLNVTGIATLAGILDVDLYDLGGGMFSPSLGDTFDILTAESINGQFDFLSLASLASGLTWHIDYLIDEINTTDVVRLTVTSVPIPAAVWLFGSGLLGLIGFSRRNKAA